MFKVKTIIALQHLQTIRNKYTQETHEIQPPRTSATPNQTYFPIAITMITLIEPTQSNSYSV
jgi:hypothetical protein